MRFERLAAPHGSLVIGLALDQLDDDELAQSLTAEVERQGVVVVHDLELSPTDLLRFGRLFGSVELATDVALTLPRHPEIVAFSNLRNDQIDVDATRAADNLTPRWHADGSFRPVPPRITLSYAVEVPARGGQTQFADMRRALLLLPPEDRDEIAPLRLVHRSSTDNRTDANTTQAVEHPWIRTNRDGSKSLYMGAHASHIVGRDAAESRQWFAEIEAQLPVHDVFYEHRWRPRDLVIHDNRMIMHRTLGYDIANERRVLHCIGIAGDPTDWPRAD